MSLREAVEKYKSGDHRTTTPSGPRTRIVMELTGSTHAILPGQALEVYDLSSRRVVGDGYTLRLIAAHFSEDGLLATPERMWDPQELRAAISGGYADPEDLVSSPGGVWDLSPDRYFAPGLHLSSQRGAGGGTQAWQRPLTLQGLQEVSFETRTRVPFLSPYWAVEDSNGEGVFLPEVERTVRVRRVDIPFTMSPVDLWKPFAKTKWSGYGGGLRWCVRASEAVRDSRRGKLYLVRPGKLDRSRVDLPTFWGGEELIDYTYSEVPGSVAEKYPRCGAPPQEVIRWYNGENGLVRPGSLARGCTAALRQQV